MSCFFGSSYDLWPTKLFSSCFEPHTTLVIPAAGRDPISLPSQYHPHHHHYRAGSREQEQEAGAGSREQGAGSRSREGQRPPVIFEAL